MPAKKECRPAPKTLRMWRLHRKLTLEEVGDRINVGSTAVHKWETGKTPVDLEILSLLASVYDAEPAALLFPPTAGRLVHQMRAAWEILARSDPALAQKWLDIGRSMAGEAKNAPPNPLPSLTKAG